MFGNPKLFITTEDVKHLSDLYQMIARKSAGSQQVWISGLQALYKCGIGMEETTWKILGGATCEEFIDWVSENGAYDELTEPDIADVLNEEDLNFWKKNGYVVVKNAATAEQVKAATDAIWAFYQGSPDEPETWYNQHAAKRGLMLVFTQHPALRALRNSARVRKAYEQLYGTTAIFKTIDKVSINPPETASYRFMGSAVHWDMSLALPIPEKYQGLMYLTNVGAEDGAFKCVPGFHHRLEEWLSSVPEGVNTRDYAVAVLKPEPVIANAGDFIIWHQALPHCASPNLGKHPRLVQYLTYMRVGHQDHDVWI